MVYNPDTRMWKVVTLMLTLQRDLNSVARPWKWSVDSLKVKQRICFSGDGGGWWLQQLTTNENALLNTVSVNDAVAFDFVSTGSDFKI